MLSDYWDAFVILVGLAASTRDRRLILLLTLLMASAVRILYSLLHSVTYIVYKLF